MKIGGIGTSNTTRVTRLTEIAGGISVSSIRAEINTLVCGGTSEGSVGALKDTLLGVGVHEVARDTALTVDITLSISVAA